MAQRNLEIAGTPRGLDLMPGESQPEPEWNPGITPAHSARPVIDEDRVGDALPENPKCSRAERGEEIFVMHGQVFKWGFAGPVIEVNPDNPGLLTGDLGNANPG